MDLQRAISPGPEALRALAHPMRVRILGMLRMDGPATATTLAQRLGLNSGATSYHLRQLAKHGFIEDDHERGNGRDRWWRAAHDSTRVSRVEAVTEDEHDTHEAYLQAIGVVYAGQLQRAIEQERTLPRAWREAGTFSDWGLRLTPERAKELKTRLAQVLEDFDEDEADTPGALSYEVNINAFLHPDAIADAESDRDE